VRGCDAQVNILIVIGVVFSNNRTGAVGIRNGFSNCMAMIGDRETAEIKGEP